jgi:hypothetical protein
MGVSQSVGSRFWFLVAAEGRLARPGLSSQNSHAGKETRGRSAMMRATKRAKYGEKVKKKSEQIRVNPTKSE